MRKLFISSICVLSFFALFTLSCSNPVDFNNPFDLNVSLSSPSDLKIISMKETSLALKWNNNININNQNQGNNTKIIIEQSLDGNSFKSIDTLFRLSSSTTFTAAFVPNQTYYFRLYLLLGNKVTGNSNIVSGMESDYAPTNFKIDNGSETNRRLSWKDNSTTELGFRITRKLGISGNFAVIAEVPPSTTSFVDTTTIITDTTYYYRVCAFFKNSISSNYDSLFFSLPFTAPSGIAITNLSPTSIQLSWNNNSSIGQGFIIEKHERGGNYYVLAKTTSNSTTLVDNLLDSNKDYFYRIKAFSKYNQSKYSDETIIGYYPANTTETYLNNIYFGSYCPVQSSPDGKYLCFAGIFVNDPDNSNYGHFLIYGTVSPLYKNAYHGTAIYSTAFSRDDNLLATFSNDSLIKIWNISNLSVSQSIHCLAHINIMIFSGDNSRLIGIGGDNKIYCWNVNSGSLIYISSSYSQKISSVDLSVDGQTLALASGNIVRLLNLSTGNTIYTFPSYPADVEAVKYSTNNLLAVMSGGNRLDIWDGTTKVLKNSLTGLSIFGKSFFFTNDNNFIILYSYNNPLLPNYSGYEVWRLSDSQFVREWDGLAPDVVFQVQGYDLIYSYAGDNWEEITSRMIYNSWDIIKR